MLDRGARVNIVGVMPCRNEAWVLPASIPAAMKWCDSLCVLVHCSIDDTLSVVEEMAERYAGRVFFETVETPEWDEADFRGRLLASARSLGATHVSLVDADEVATAGMIAGIRSAAEAMKPGELLRVPWIHCWRSLNRYRCDDSPFGTATVPVLFADDSRLTYMAGADNYQLHKRFPVGCEPRAIWTRDSGCGVLHLQHAVWKRVDAKQRNYMATEKRRWGKVHANYMGTLDETGLVTAPIPDDWWPVAGSKSLIDLAAEPWQAAELTKAQ